MASIIQQLHDSEINGEVAWDAEGVRARLGCPLARDFVAEANLRSFAEAESWLHEAALQHYPKSAYAQHAKRRPRTPASRSAIEALRKADIPGAASWLYNGAFCAELAGIEAEATPEMPRLDNWRRVESWLTSTAARRFPDSALGKRT